MRLLAFAGLLVPALFAQPAAADDSMLCVQSELLARGFDPGPLDGVMGTGTRNAAAAYLGTVAFPMPELSAATGAEWCAVLRSWTARDLVPLNDGLRGNSAVARLLNTNPEALPVGLWFDDSVPIEWRELIIEDLVWLNGLGPLEGTDGLTAYLGLPRSVTGTDLLGWLLTYVAGVSADVPCPARSIQLIPGGNGKDGFTTFIPVEFLRCYSDEGVAAFVGWFQEVEEAVLQIADLGETIVTGGDNSAAIMYLTPSLFEAREAFWGEAEFRDRVERLITLFHEAFHIAHPVAHPACRHDFFFRTSTELAIRGTYDAEADEVCDDGFGGAYAAGALVAEVLADNCDCSVERRLEAMLVALGEWARVDIPLPQPWLIPNAAGLRGTGLPGRTVESIPPRQYFELLVRATGLHVDLEPLDRVWLRQAETALDLATAAVGNRTADRSAWGEVPEFPVVIPLADWPSVWLARASRAAADGYNVPNARVAPCSAAPFGCATDWLAGVRPLANGASERFALGQPGVTHWATFSIGPQSVTNFQLRAENMPTGSIILELLRVSPDEFTVVRSVDALDGIVVARLPAGDYYVRIYDNRERPTAVDYELFTTWNADATPAPGGNPGDRPGIVVAPLVRK